MSRQAVLRAVTGTFVLAAAALVIAVLASHLSKDSKHTVQTFAMDAPCTVTVYGDDCSQSVKARIDGLEKIISAYDENSETAEINLSHGGKMSSDLQNITNRFLDLYSEYGSVSPVMGSIIKLWNINGDDPKVPTDDEVAEALSAADIENISVDGESVRLENNSQIDFGAVGKGFALDEVKKVLAENNAECAVVSFGSSTLLYGEKPNGEAFNVSVTDPESGGELLRFSCGEGFVSTSGGYERFFEADGERYIHIFDEKTGYPSDTDLTSVTVICQDGMLSDFLSTRIFLGGSGELDRWLNEESIEIIAVDADGEVYISEGLRDSVEMA